MPTVAILSAVNASFAKSIKHLQAEYSRLQTGTANASMVEGLQVDAYGDMQPLKNIANISINAATTIQIQPWDKSLLGSVEKSISASDLQLPVVNNGEALLINIPPLTEDRRKNLTKVVGQLAEETRITVRSIRQDAMQKIKKLKETDNLSENIIEQAEVEIQKEVDKINNEITKMTKHKEEQIMKI